MDRRIWSPAQPARTSNLKPRPTRTSQNWRIWSQQPNAETFSRCIKETSLHIQLLVSSHLATGPFWFMRIESLSIPSPCSPRIIYCPWAVTELVMTENSSPAWPGPWTLPVKGFQNLARQKNPRVQNDFWLNWIQILQNKNVRIFPYMAVLNLKNFLQKNFSRKTLVLI